MCVSSLSHGLCCASFGASPPVPDRAAVLDPEPPVFNRHSLQPNLTPTQSQGLRAAAAHDAQRNGANTCRARVAGTGCLRTGAAGNQRPLLDHKFGCTSFYSQDCTQKVNIPLAEQLHSGDKHTKTQMAYKPTGHLPHPPLQRHARALEHQSGAARRAAALYRGGADLDSDSRWGDGAGARPG